MGVVIFSFDEINEEVLFLYELLLDGVIKGEHRKEFNVTIAYNDVSLYMCELLYKPFVHFECLLRKLLYEILIKVYGGNWYDETLKRLIDYCPEFEEVHNSINKKQKGHASLVEVALQEMDYSCLKTYLFLPTSRKRYEEVLNVDLSDDKLDHMEKDELVGIIKNMRPQSLWERLFGDYAGFSDFPKDLSTIQNTRNKVMHAKYISFSEFSDIRVKLNDLTELLNETIDRNEKSEFTPIQCVDAIQALSLINETLIRDIDLSIIESVTNTLDDVFTKLEEVSHIDTSSLINGLLLLGGLASYDVNEADLSDNDATHN